MNSPVIETRDVAALTTAIGDAPVGGIAEGEAVRLSFAQEQLWFLQRFEPTIAAYNLPRVFRLTGALDSDALGRAFDALIGRHAALRTRFFEHAGIPMQVMETSAAFELQRIDLSALSVQARETRLEHVIDEVTSHVFDLGRPPAMVARLARLAEDDHVLALCLHHIISDAWSNPILARDLAEAYKLALHKPGAVHLDPLPVQYVDYADWQRRRAQAGELDRHLEYWNRYLGDNIQPLQLPLDFKRPQTQSFEGAAVEFPIDKSQAAALHDLCRRERCTPFVVLLAAWQILLARYCGSSGQGSEHGDFAVGVPSAGRYSDELDDLMGFFVTTHVYRARVTAGMSLREVCRQVRADSIAALNHGEMPFDLLLASRKDQREPGRSPLFQVMFNVRMADDAGALALEGLDAEAVVFAQRTAKYELSLDIGVGSDEARGTLEYNRQLVSAASARRLVDYYLRVLAAMVTDTDQPVAAVTLLGNDDYRQLRQWGANDVRPTAAPPVHRLIEAQVRQYPQATALIVGEDSLSYSELNVRANRLAHHLIGLGVQPEMKVGIALERSLDMVVGLLAVLKAGATYVPLDPDYPVDRLAYMVEDSGIGLLLTQSAITQCIPMPAATPVLQLDTLDLQAEPQHDPIAAVHGENLAYVIYTSGSTGQPKGVGVAHQPLAMHVQAVNEAYGMVAEDRELHVASINFDIAHERWLATLCAGATLVLWSIRKRSITELVDTIAEKCISSVFLPTAYANETVNVLRERKQVLPLRLCVVGGEAWQKEAVSTGMRFLAVEKMINAYGPTETVIAPTLWAVTGDIAGNCAPIGRPVGDRTAWVLDGDMNLVPPTVAGELYLGGSGLARGYLNRAALTAERFVADPFSANGNRLYRTGDLVRWNGDGELEYLGRIDHQVKIRGFRIELGEVEAQLLAQPEVREAVVVAHVGANGTRLVAYVSMQAKNTIDAAELRERLGRALPDYMVPSAIVVLDSLPLTANGKVDRKALPAPEFDSSRDYEAPQGEVEQTLAAIWAEVLGVERVGRHDNFFELGGHSLMALSLLERLRAQGFTVQVRTLFQHPALAAFADAIAQQHDRGDVAVPPNLIPDGALAIKPEMLTLIQLDAAQISRIEAATPGGAANIQDIYPLAPLQEGILFHHLLQQQGDAYITPQLLSFDSQSRLQHCIASFNRVIERHDILRTAVLWEGLDEPVQVVCRKAPLGIDWLQAEATGDAASWLNAQVDPRHHRIDVRCAPMIRAVAVHDVAKDRWLLQLPSHHLVLDHTTLERIIEEIALIQQGREAELPAPVPFRRFVAQTRLGLSRAEHEAFFTRLLGDVEEPTAPFGLLDVQGDGSDVDEVRHPLPAELSARIRQQAQRYGVSAAALFHLAWAQVLASTAGRDDVVFGTVLFGRMQGGAGADRALGMFINTLPVRIRLAGRTVVQSLREIQAVLTDLMHHEHASLALAQRCSGLPGGTPLFSALFNYRYNVNKKHIEQDADDTATAWEGMEALGGSERTNYPVDMSVDDLGQGFALAAQVNKAIGARRVCEYLQAAVTSIVDALADAPQRPMGELSVLGEIESAQLRQWGENPQRYPTAQLLHRLIEQRVRECPHATALIFDDVQLSYAELNTRANCLAHHLIGLGVRPEMKVGIALVRGIDMVVGLLAIMKTGAAYVPLDPEYPPDRLAHMVDDSGIGFLLTHRAVKHRMPVGDFVRVLEIDALKLDAESAANPAIAVHGESLAYVIYTSGSTGKPKGVGISHHCLVEHAQVSVGFFGLTSADRMLQFATLNFDGCIEQLFPPLIAGAALVLRGPTLWDSTTFYQQLIDKRISVADLTTAYWLLLVQDFARAGVRDYGVLRQVHAGGEAMPPEGIKAWRDAGLAHVNLLNTYGPTEATVTASVVDCDVFVRAEKPLPVQMPIGSPLPGRVLWVVDGELNRVPQGVAGELLIGGELLARGYLNRAALTAERFVADPFSANGSRLYRTGDLVRWNGDGQLEYLGRIDHQIKIRGFRVELGEVEAQLLAQAEVREAVVVAQAAVNGTRLVAYVSTQANNTIDAAELRESVACALPDYMVPSLIVVLASLPLTANGKVDRKALSAPEFDSSRDYEAPQCEVEQTLAAIWAEVLGVERIGRHDNFFELGGDSILSLKVVARAHKHGLLLTPQQLFEHRSVASVALATRAQTPNIDPINVLTPADRQRPLLASYAQSRQWFLWQLEPESTAYHISGALKLRGVLDIEALKASFDALIARHESLRTIFKSNADGFVEQVILQSGCASIEEIDLSLLADAEREIRLRETAAQLKQLPFDLEAGPLLRVGLIREAADAHVLVVVMHHIVSDDWSMQIIVEEFVARYRGLCEGGQQPLQRLAPLPIQYADYAMWQRNWMEAGEKQRQLDYWKAQLGDEHPILQLPADHARKADGVYRAAAHDITLPETLVQALQQRARSEGATLFMLLLAGVQTLLHRYSGQHDIRVGVPIANRHRVEIEGVVGFFVNTQVLRNVMDGRTSLAQVLAQAKAAALGAQTHQDLPFEQLVEALSPERNFGINPLFQVMYNHLRQDQQTLEQLPGLDLDDYALAEQGAQFELSIDSSEATDGGVRVSFTYAKELFGAHTIERMAQHLQAVLWALATAPQQAVGEVQLLGESERQQLQQWGVNAQRFPNAQPLHRLIEQRVQACPEGTAVIFDDVQLSYVALNVRANRLAHHLIGLGVQPERKVGIALERGIDMVVGLLAILKTGAAYVPLDPEYPRDRLAHLVEDSGIGLLLTQGAVKHRIPVSDSIDVLEIDGLDLAAESAQNPHVIVHGESLAYVIYTSGSTGKPKGVGISHCSLVEHAQVSVGFFGLTPTDRILQFATLNFDGCIEQLFPPLIAGAAIVLRGPTLWDSTTFYRELIDKRISVADLTTAYWLLLVQDFARAGIRNYGALRQVHAGGEAMPPEGIKAWRDAGLGHVNLLNTYGPTEATVTASVVDCGAFVRAEKLLPAQMPIGTPLAGRALWVVDGALNLVPQSVAGELLIGGELLARGYLNRAALTAERFVADPFSDNGGRLYRTGDLVRWNAEGQLEYLGRIDHQVKIRGFRIELGEVEAQLLVQPEVREAVVVAHASANGTRLVAYLSAEHSIDVAILREHLSRVLPDYMVPSVIVVLESLPLNANGKVDRKALPEPEFDSGHQYEVPQGNIEQTLARIWAEVLGVERVGRHDNFFELGGHSLMALSLLERLRAQGFSVQVRTLFQHPVLAAFAEAISQQRDRADVVVPPNLIAAGCSAITPDMLTLISLDAAQIARIETAIPGGSANIQDIYPLAPLQEGILFHHLLQQQGDAYITPQLLGFDSEARLQHFIASFNRVIERHDILRTAVLWEGLDEPVQVVCRKAALDIEWLQPDADAAADAAQWLNAAVDPHLHRIDVRCAPMLRAVAVHDAANQRWLLQLPSHHLVLDHTTLERIIDEIALIQQGQEQTLPAPVPFRNFVAQARLGVSGAEHDAFFSRLLGDIVEPTAPFGLLDVQGDGSDVDEVRLPLPATLSTRIRQQAQRHGVSAAALFHLAWALVLARTAGRDDVVFGTVLFGRMRGGEGAERALGLFINTLPLRIRLAGRDVIQSLRETQAGLTDLLHHEHASLSQALRCSGLPAGTPLFSALFNYRYNSAQDEGPAAPWQGIEALGSKEQTNYPLGMSVDDLGAGFALVGQANEVVGGQRLCELLQATMAGLVEALTSNPHQPVLDVPVLDQSEQHQLQLCEVNTQRHGDLPPVHRLFEAQVRQCPQATALIFDQAQLNYGELNTRANRLAHYLIRLGVQPEMKVGIALERCSDMVVGLLAILKAGASYVPLDLEYPSERLAYIAADSGIGLLLTHEAVQHRVPLPAHVKVLQLDAMNLALEPEYDPAVGVHDESIAYVIYTSGSTGRPKGAAIRHRALSSCMTWMQRSYRLTPADTVLHKAPFGFDVSVWEIFWPLTAGVRLVVANPGDHRDPARITRLILEHGITTLNFVPAMLQAFLAHPGIEAETRLRYVICGGEAMPAATQAEALRRLKGVSLQNLYGPTETTIHVTRWTCRDDGHSLVPIGQPIAETQARVLNERLAPVPRGVAGELYIGGELLARGYLNRAGLTAERFVADPFSADGGRLYRTGDLVRWNSEGQLEYLGRIDHQVKIRGFRIELGEVEAQLLAQVEVREAVVVAQPGPNGHRLIAYVAAAADCFIDAQQLRECLGRELPDHMVPAAIAVLDALPLNANGKVDRKALPQPAFDSARAYEAPRDEVEQALAEIWSQVLEVEQVGRNDNFFELGGHSVAILRVQSKIQQRFAVKLPLPVYFDNLTLSALAQRVSETLGDADESDSLKQMAALLDMLEH